MTLSPEEQAKAATKIGEIELAITQQRILVGELERGVVNASRKHVLKTQARLAEERQILAHMQQEANRLRAQIGAPLVIPNAEPVASSPRRRSRSCGVLIGLCLVLGLCVILFLIFVPAPVRPRRSTAGHVYQTVDVRDLKKNPATYNGTDLKLTGKVFRISEDSGRTQLQIWVPVPGGGDLDREAVMVNYTGTLPGIYKDTEITVLGQGSGAASGTNAFGAKVEQPLIDADEVGP
jgi:hypothetical protein